MADHVNKEQKKIFQQIDVMSTTKNSITIGWKLKSGNSTTSTTTDRKGQLRGYAVKYHAVGSSIKQGVESLGPSLVTYVIKQLHENTVYEICVRAITALTETNEAETIHEVSHDKRSVLVRGGLLDYPQVVHKRSEDAHPSSDFVSAGDDDDSFPGKAATVPSIISSSSSSGQNLEFPSAKNLDWYESCIVSSTASSSLSLALGSTLGAFLALGVIVFFVLIAKWQHKNRRQRLKKRWIASNISASERTQRMAINPELLHLDDLMPGDPCDAVDEPWPSDKHESEGDRGRDHHLANDIRLNSLDDDLLLLNERRDEIDPQMRRSKEAVDALRRLLQDENIYAESFVISTPSIKDGSESYNLLVPLSSAQSLLPYLVDNGDDEFPALTNQNRHHYLQHKGASRTNENVRKLKFKKHFTIDYSGCSNDVMQEQARVVDNALQQQVNCSFAAKQSRLFKLQTLKTVDLNSSLDTDCDDCQDKLDSSDSHENDLTPFQMANDGFDYSNGNDWKQQQQHYPMQQQQQQLNGASDDNDDENNNNDDETNSGNLCRSFSVEW